MTFISLKILTRQTPYLGEQDSISDYSVFCYILENIFQTTSKFSQNKISLTQVFNDWYIESEVSAKMKFILFYFVLQIWTTFLDII